jgi:hypothetical protein
MNKVVDAKANPDHTLDLVFSDGSKRRFDAKPYLDKGVFRELKDISYFRRVSLAYGTVQWPNEQDFAPETLYFEGSEID